MGSCCSKSTVAPMPSSRASIPGSAVPLHASRETSRVGRSISRETTQDSILTYSVYPTADEFPDPASIPVMMFTPPDKIPPLKIEDTFWPGKRKLIPDYNAMLRIDERALKASASLKKDSIKLVQYLVQVYKTDLEKARVLMRWIGDNIQYDCEGLASGSSDSSVETVLRTGKAVCEGYKNVIVHFSDVAGIECMALSGASKGAGYYPGKPVGSKLTDHAWAKLKINGDWYLCDPTWAAGATQEGVFKKKWNEWWFLTHPEAFLYSHLPYDEFGTVINTEQQLVEAPYESREDWGSCPMHSPVAYWCGIKPITHKSSVIETSSSELEICFYNEKANYVTYFTAFEKHDSGCITKYEHDKNAMIYSVGKEIHMKVTLPGQGDYILEVWANLLNDSDDNMQGASNLVEYQIKNKSPKSPSQPMGDTWGETAKFKAAGFKVISPKSAIIETKDGMAEIKLALPTSGVVNYFHRLNHAKIHHQDLEPCVYAEKRKARVTYHIRCPEAGDFMFEIYYKPEQDNSSGGFYTGAAYLIRSRSPAGEKYPFVGNHGHTSGPQTDFYQMGLSTTARSSTLKIRKGRALLHIQKPNGIKIWAKLVCQTDNQNDHFTQSEENGRVTFEVKPQLPKPHFLNIYGCEEVTIKGGTYSGSLLASYCISRGNISKNM